MNDANLSTFSSDILVVDDVSENLKLLLNLLKTAGYKVRPASNGAEALDAVMSKKPDLILLDIKMPGMDGFEVCNRLKADSQSKDIPIIFISALGETADKVKAFHAGGVDYISKPFQEEEVLMRVQTHIELHRMRMNLEGIVAERTLNLQISEERFRMTFEQAAVGVAHVSPEGRFLRINQKFCDIVGYSKEEMHARTFQEITHPDDLDSDLESMQQVLAGEIKNYSMKKRYFRKDKSIVWINLTVSLLRKETGDPDYFIAIVEDISEQMRAQQLLSESETKYRTLIEHAPDAIFIVDGTTGQFLDSNLQGLKMFGYSREKMLSFTPVDFSPPVAPDGRPVPEVLQERLASLIPEKQIMFEWVHQHADGHEIPCEIRAVLLPYSDRRMLRASMIDITERKQAEKVLEERLRFKELVSGISQKFIGLSGVEFEQAIQDTLAEVGSYFEVDTVRLYRLSTQGDVLAFRLQWRSEHLAPPEELPTIHKIVYPNLAAHYSKGETIVFNRIEECPPIPELLNALNFFGTKAGVGVPLELDGSGVDVFAMDRVLTEHVWPDDIIEQSKVIGQVILSAIRRREAETELQDSYDEIKQLKERLELENIHIREELKIQYNYEEIVGDSPAIKSTLNQAEKVAGQNTSVLILGETGTGKELLARVIHNLSPRKNRAMIKVNCAALPATLVESELFGREKGAFTGALSRQIGRFEAAEGSTIFLDEIGDLPLEMQAKLLRVLHEGEFERLGSTKTISVDVRVIAATNHDLEQAVRESRFRKDLYYRLSVFPITVPALRERAEDIPLLVWAFIKELGRNMGKPIEMISKKTMSMLRNYFWPGNIRELKNVIERAMILNTGSTLQIDPIQTKTVDQDMTLEGVERSHILEVLDRTGWKVSGKNGAAEILGLKSTTLEARMKKMGIKRP